MDFFGFLQDWAGLAALILSVVGGFLQLRKTKAETKEKEASFAKLVTESATSLIKPLQNRIEVLEGDVKRLTDENVSLRTVQDAMKTTITELSAGIEILSGQLISLGHEPKWNRSDKTKKAGE